jgi:hypothetical protein
MHGRRSRTGRYRFPRMQERGESRSRAGGCLLLVRGDHGVVTGRHWCSRLAAVVGANAIESRAGVITRGDRVPCGWARRVAVSGGARLVEAGARMGHVVARATRRRSRSRRRWMAAIDAAASATLTTSAIVSHGVSSGGAGASGAVIGSGSP